MSPPVVHKPDCSLATSHHLTCTCGATYRAVLEAKGRPPVSVSVLLPTRGRVTELRSSVQTLLTLAADPDRVQVMYAVDYDDTSSHDEVCAMARPADWVYVSPERFGYLGLHRYVNELVPQAAGEWLMLWNDDAQMITGRWDEIICEHDGQDLVLWLRTEQFSEMLLFPVVPARYVQALGHFSRSPHNDTWWAEVGSHLGVNRQISVDVHHWTPSSFHDPGFYSAEQDAMRRQDAETIRGLIQ